MWEYRKFRGDVEKKERGDGEEWGRRKIIKKE